MTDTILGLFHDSLDRCNASPRFLERFYEMFLASSPEVAAKFAHTDFRKQRRALMAAFYEHIGAANGSPEALAHLQELAVRHSRRGLDVRPELHDLWLECLLKAVAEHDPKFDAKVENAWRTTLARGMAIMKAAY